MTILIIISVISILILSLYSWYQFFHNIPSLGDKVRIKYDLISDKGSSITAGAIGIIVDDTIADDHYLIEFKIPAPNLVGGYTYDQALIGLEDFEIVRN